MIKLLFSSLLFLFLYLPIVLAGYYLIPYSYRNIFLFIANLIFYGWGEPVYILLMLFSTVWDYTCGMIIEKYRSNKHICKAALFMSVIVNLGLLGFFKYSGFVCGVLRGFPGMSWIPLIEIPLPIGISFYTFQTMSYTIDVYRNDAPVQKNVIAFGTYVTLFPQLIAGPIVRYKDVAEQLDGRKETVEMFTRGVKLFIVGLAKKVLIANQMGILWDELRAAAQDNGILGCWIGIISYAFQIYFDFSGYSDMARGLGNMFGFEFLKNFDYPYISKSITEFWRRWHISLGTWFREYVYIPLGGNRKGKKRLIINLITVWFLTGFWHGASFNYIFWGIYFGVILIFEKFFLLERLKRAPAWISHIYSCIFILVGWVIFYFENMNEMTQYFKLMFTASNGFIGKDAIAIIISYIPLLIAAALGSTPIINTIYQGLKHKKYGWLLDSLLCIVSLLICTASLVSQTYNPFLYFRF